LSKPESYEGGEFGARRDTVAVDFESAAGDGILPLRSAARVREGRALGMRLVAVTRFSEFDSNTGQHKIRLYLGEALRVFECTSSDSQVARSRPELAAASAFDGRSGFA
jgi:hypothetical protein